MKLPFKSGKKNDGPATVEPQYDCDDDAAIVGLSDLYIPADEVEISEDMTQHSDGTVQDLADVLVDMGVINSSQRSQLRMELSKRPDQDIKAVAFELKLVKDTDMVVLCQAQARLYGYEYRDIKPEQVDKKVFEKLDIDFIKDNSVVPVGIEGGKLVVATSEPANVFAIENVKSKTGMELQIVVSPPESIDLICESFRAQENEYSVDEIINDMTEVEVVQEQEKDYENLEEMAGQSPVIKFVNYLISNAISEGASDIHIEPKVNNTRIRYRIDGVLFETMQSPLKMHPAVVSRIKIMANLDISERRLPQDGKVSVIIGGRTIDLRVSILPTSNGEKVVIRVLDSNSIIKGLDQLGMEPDLMETFAEQVKLPHGIFLVTGPTGSGKSTTLYTALRQMDGDTMNISTVEDPVEYELDFCNQVQANDKIGMTFAAALRSLLRQDPDIVMIGEIRDNETAKIAVQAALTGHLVLSTLHTNDAASSITRLVNIGVDAYLIAASLNAVLAQRLVRRICPECKKQYKVPKDRLDYLQRAWGNNDKNSLPEKLYKGKGCDACRGSGYAGRVGIYELLVVDDKFRDMINKDASVSNMRQTFMKSSQKSLFEDGMQKVIKGLTTVDEVLRVTEVHGINTEQ